MAEKIKFNVEYEVKSSPKILFGFLNEPNGLAQWFADDVTYRDQVYTFTWDGEQQKAKLERIAKECGRSANAHLNFLINKEINKPKNKK